MAKTANKQKSKPAGYILGVVSFIPGLGLIFGTIGIIVGLQRKQKGVVILNIAGILSFIILYSVIAYSGSDRFTFLKTNLAGSEMRHDQSSLDSYHLLYGKFPSQLSELQISNRNTYITDPWRHAYIYEVSPDGNSYNLRSAGPDGISNTSDDVTPSK